MKMNGLSTIVILIIFCLTLTLRVKSQSETTYITEGVVVAFQKNMRCPTCQSSAGNLAIGIENWILKIDKWNGKRLKKDKYVLVQYQMYDRSLTESEINKKLRFNIRERKEHEKSNACLSKIVIKKGDEYFLRPVEFRDYELTEPGKTAGIPKNFKKLLCFIIDSLPEEVRKNS